MYGVNELKRLVNGSLEGMQPNEVFWDVIKRMSSYEGLAGVNTKEGIAGLMSYSFLPDFLLWKMAEMDYSNIACLSEAIDAWGKAGYLRFTPFVSPYNDNPTLSVRHNIHIHLFRRQMFQASGNPHGVIEMEQGSININNLLKLRGYEKDWASGDYLYNLLCYAAFIDVGFHYRSVVQWFKSNTKEADKFVHDSYLHHKVELKYTLEDLFKYISVEDGARISTNRHIFRIAGHGGAMCEFAYGDKTIQVMVSSGNSEITKLWTLTIPDPKTYIESDDMEAVEDYIYTLMYTPIGTGMDNSGVLLLLIMLLKFTGIQINWICSYQLKQLQPVKASNCPNVMAVESLQDFYDIEPDNY